MKKLVLVVAMFMFVCGGSFLVKAQSSAEAVTDVYKRQKESLWTQSQRIRAEILFKEYPDIKTGYSLSMRLGLIYHQCKFKDIALTRLARWYDCLLYTSHTFCGARERIVLITS